MFRLRLVASLFLLPTLTLGRTIMFGDSMFSNGAVKGALEALADGRVNIENSALTGASFHDGWVPSIPAEYNYISKNPVPVTAIMDGGGNDVMSVKDSCLVYDARCEQQITEAMAILEGLLETMHNDGIQHVIFMGPFYVQNLNKAVDMAYPMLEKVCKNAAIDCHLADTRDINPPLGSDGIHPTDEGFKMLAERIWEVKLDNDIPIF